MPTNSAKLSLTSNINARLRAWFERNICGGPEYGEDPHTMPDNWSAPFLGMPNYIHGPAREAHKLPMTSDYETWLCQDFLTRTQFRFTFKWWDMDDRDSYYELIGRWVAGGDRL